MDTKHLNLHVRLLLYLVWMVLGYRVYISNPTHWLPLAEGEEVALRMIFNKLFTLVRFNYIK